MTHLTVRDFRNQMAVSFDLVDAGEQVVIRRKNRLYAIVPMEEEAVTSELTAKIEQARKELKEGKTISLKSHEDVDRYFKSM